MSHSYFESKQYAISSISDQVKHLFDSNFDKTRNEMGDLRGKFFAPEVMKELETAIQVLQVAKIYIQRIDHLVSGDDDEEAFLNRLKADLGQLRQGDF